MNGRPHPAAEGRVAPVSVVIPCFRCADTIADAISSVATQTLRPFEILLVDDCSADGTPDVLREIASAYADGWIKVIVLTENAGPSKARNTGWAHASQEYIAFLDADDTWAPAKLELQMAALRDDPEIALIAHRMEVRERHQAPQQPRPPVRVMIVPRYQMLLSNPFPTASVLLRRDLPFRFDENYRRAEDFLLWAQIALSGHRCAKIDQTLAAWHKATYGAGGLTQDLAAMHAAGRQVRMQLRREGLLSRPEYYAVRILGVLRRTRRHAVLLARRYRERRRVAAGRRGT